MELYQSLQELSSQIFCFFGNGWFVSRPFDERNSLKQVK
jgi:hypothetical protein